MTADKSWSEHNAGRHWNTVAAQWRKIAPPLRPCAEDLAIFENEFAAPDGAEAGAPPQALLLGVTPEIALMSWPAGTKLLAVDRSEDMIGAIWPGDVEGVRRAVRGEWLGITGPLNHYDFVICDGSFNTMAFPVQFLQLAANMAAVLKPGGLLAMRHFVHPPENEAIEDVIDDALRGRIGNFHIFKFRLMMAVQSCSNSGVVLDDVWQAWSRSELSVEGLSRATGWPAEVIETIDLYRGKDVRLAFATFDEVRQAMANNLESVGIHIPSYEMGDRCPILSFRAPGVG